MKTVIITFFLFTIAQCSTILSRSAQTFGIEFLNYTKNESNDHLVICPFGVWSLMTGVTVFANEICKKELHQTFMLSTVIPRLVAEYKQLTKTVLDIYEYTDGVTITNKNLLIIDEEFQIMPAFRARITNIFNFTIMQLNFKEPNVAARIANRLMLTCGATAYNVVRLDNFTKSRMILTNVISFKGLWSTPFNANDTMVEPFYDENKKKVGKVNMMYLKAHVTYARIDSLQSTIIILPYGNDKKYFMLVMLPYPKIKVNDVYKQVMVTFTKFTILLQRKMEFSYVNELTVKLPRFKINTNMVLNKPLNNMGVFAIFQPKRATFREITDEDIFVSAIVHKADIEVTEAGTVASAATTTYFAERILKADFHANRPFIYLIMERTSATVIFSGIYAKPTVF